MDKLQGCHRAGICTFCWGKEKVLNSDRKLELSTFILVCFCYYISIFIMIWVISMKIKSVMVYILTTTLLLITGVTINTNVYAKTIVDNQGETIEIPDKYFTQVLTPAQDNLAVLFGKYLIPYADDPNKQFPSEFLKISGNMQNMGQFIDYIYSYAPGVFEDKENLQQWIKNFLNNPSQMKMLCNSVLLKTENKTFAGNDYSRILNPSNITIFNDTNNVLVSDAINQSINQWNKSSVVHFSITDDPYDARIIVKSASKGDIKLEENTEGIMKITRTYGDCLIQADIILSPEIIDGSDINSSKLVHTIEHEMGHVLGMPDLY